MKVIRNYEGIRRFWQTIFILGIFLSALAFYQTIQQGNAMGIAIHRSKWVFLLGLYMPLRRCADLPLRSCAVNVSRASSRAWMWSFTLELCGGL